MKTKLLKNSVKEIKDTLKRFISILLMSFLGVGFFSGLVACGPDMREAIDAIIMMVITLVGYIGGFSYFMIRVFKKERSKSKE